MGTQIQGVWGTIPLEAGIPDWPHKTHQFGYGDTSLPGTNYSENLYTVPDNTIRIIRQITIQYVGTSPLQFWVETDYLGSAVWICGKKSPVTLEFYTFPMKVIQYPGTILRVQIQTPTLNNDAYTHVIAEDFYYGD